MTVFGPEKIYNKNDHHNSNMDRSIAISNKDIKQTVHREMLFGYCNEWKSGCGDRS